MLWLELLIAALPACALADQIAFRSPASDTKTFNLVHAVHHSTVPSYLGRAAHLPISIAQALSPLHEYPLHDLRIKTTRQRVWRPRARGGSAAYMDARMAHVRESRGVPHPAGYTAMGWDEIEVEAPDVNDMQTLSSLAKMTSNAYTKEFGQGGWYDLGERWNVSTSFGWLDDGLRGHVFATPDNSTVVVALKGTSAFLVGGGGGTSHNDKRNDNLLFSCCCARIDWSWSTVCDCYQGGWKCGSTCVEDALIDKSVYFPLATDLYNNVTQLYPNAQIWLTGHSLGGALSSLMSLTFGVPCVSFEAPGDLMAARRLHLPMPPGRPADSPFGAVTHVYHTADPIPQGACTGALSACGLVGFAMEARCHTGQTILFDTVGKLGWSVDTRTHSIAQVIDRILVPDWDKPKELTEGHRRTMMSRLRGMWPGRRKPSDEDKKPEEGGPYGLVPTPEAEEPDCVDCFRWNYTDEGQA